MSDPKDRIAMGTGPSAIALCEALGIDAKNVYSITLHCVAGEPMDLQVEYRVRDSQTRKLAYFYAGYNLVPKDVFTEATTIGDEYKSYVHGDGKGGLTETGSKP